MILLLCWLHRWLGRISSIFERRVTRDSRKSYSRLWWWSNVAGTCHVDKRSPAPSSTHEERLFSYCGVGRINHVQTMFNADKPWLQTSYRSIVQPRGLANVHCSHVTSCPLTSSLEVHWYQNQGHRNSAIFNVDVYQWHHILFNFCRTSKSI